MQKKKTHKKTQKPVRFTNNTKKQTNKQTKKKRTKQRTARMWQAFCSKVPKLKRRWQKMSVSPKENKRQDERNRKKTLHVTRVAHLARDWTITIALMIYHPNTIVNTAVNAHSTLLLQMVQKVGHSSHKVRPIHCLVTWGLQRKRKTEPFGAKHDNTRWDFFRFLLFFYFYFFSERKSKEARSGNENGPNVMGHRLLCVHVHVWTKEKKTVYISSCSKRLKTFTSAPAAAQSLMVAPRNSVLAFVYFWYKRNKR